MHLAQFNIGRMIAPRGDARVAEFYDHLDEMNAVADAAPGFVWRMVDGEANDATSLRPYDRDPEMLVNLSVWESRQTLFDYVYRSGHMEYLRRRREWFLPLGEVFTALWWIPEGTIPELADAMRRLEHLREHGPTPYAFTFRQAFEPEEPQSVPVDTRSAL
ncbi:DUF3291 domain-containing protein [Nocardia yunnanensis]|uniref:DUF3291 domain-containing protein n=1 Tax=Nocardia yunnanensis TaxID=2382165 RepID=A0A386ZCP5_9NOCA|nr:DUF3291 domain-containing protein [Nocardia yunnanensis]AYF74405.1 DUF3291 domain-containing protein [Nocardia yunnanensis]